MLLLLAAANMPKVAPRNDAEVTAELDCRGSGFIFNLSIRYLRLKIRKLFFIKIFGIIK